VTILKHRRLKGQDPTACGKNGGFIFHVVRSRIVHPASNTTLRMIRMHGDMPPFATGSYGVALECRKNYFYPTL
jgi:hypothetical protein